MIGVNDQGPGLFVLNGCLLEALYVLGYNAVNRRFGETYRQTKNQCESRWKAEFVYWSESYDWVIVVGERVFMDGFLLVLVFFFYEYQLRQHICKIKINIYLPLFSI
jgi:hypothetical protein